MSKNALNTEVTKLHKELETLRSRQDDGTQLNSLQEELERLRAELKEAHGHRKRLEEAHGSEKLGLEQVRENEGEREGERRREGGREGERKSNLLRLVLWQLYCLKPALPWLELRKSLPNRLLRAGLNTSELNIADHGGSQG